MNLNLLAAALERISLKAAQSQDTFLLLDDIRVFCADSGLVETWSSLKVDDLALANREYPILWNEERLERVLKKMHVPCRNSEEIKKQVICTVNEILALSLGLGCPGCSETSLEVFWDSAQTDIVGQCLSCGCVHADIAKLRSESRSSFEVWDSFERSHLPKFDRLTAGELFSLKILPCSNATVWRQPK